jgi:hypothetical protein
VRGYERILVLYRSQPNRLLLAEIKALNYPPTQKATVFETVDECVEGTLLSSYERSGVCFGGFRPTEHVEEPRASARGGSTLVHFPIIRNFPSALLGNLQKFFLLTSQNNGFINGLQL